MKKKLLLAVDTSMLMLREEMIINLELLTGRPVTPEEVDAFAKRMGWSVYDDKESLERAKIEMCEAAGGRLW